MSHRGVTPNHHTYELQKDRNVTFSGLYVSYIQGGFLVRLLDWIKIFSQCYGVVVSSLIFIKITIYLRVDSCTLRAQKTWAELRITKKVYHALTLLACSDPW